LVKGIIETIQPEEIAWLESQTVVTVIHLQNGETLYAMRNIGYFRELLIPHLPFFQISQKEIIYLPFMRRYLPMKREVILRDGNTLMASKRGGVELKQFLQSAQANDPMKSLVESLNIWLRSRKG